MQHPSRRQCRRLFLCLLLLFVLALLLLCGINAYVKHSARQYILSPEESAALPAFDCILILGCGVQGDRPSFMLADRLDSGLSLYAAGVSDKLLMSGDHGRVLYDEVNVMKQYACTAGVPSEAVFMDHAGFSTYESMYRARDVFLARRVLIVTQDYHLYRAVYVARALGLEAYGVPATASAKHAGQLQRDLREVLARCKDFAYTAFPPRPSYLGESIPVSGDGNLSNG